MKVISKAQWYKAPGSELDRLTPREDILDDIGRQKSKLNGATDRAGIEPVTASDLPGGPDPPARQRASRRWARTSKAIKLSSRRIFSFRRRYDELRLDTTTLEYCGGGEVN